MIQLISLMIIQGFVTAVVILTISSFLSKVRTRAFKKAWKTYLSSASTIKTSTETTSQSDKVH